MRILPGQIFLSRPDQPHRRVSSPKGMCLYRAIFAIPGPSGRVLGTTAGETAFFARTFTRFTKRVWPDTGRVRAAFERLFRVCEAERPGTGVRRLEAKSAALELLLAFAEVMRRPQRGQSACAYPKVEALVRRIDENPVADYSVPSLAREAALSSVALNAAFKRLTGFTPHAYVLDARVRCARRELERGQPIAAVAAKYRFPSPAHFSTVFRRIVGFPPRACREHSRK